jgi:hypothetical protein
MLLAFSAQNHESFVLTDSKAQVRAAQLKDETCMHASEVVNSHYQKLDSEAPKTLSKPAE